MDDTEVTDLRPWDPALVDWAAVRRCVAEHQAECEVYIAQRSAEARARGQRRLVDQEVLAALQGNVDACGELLALIEEAHLA